MSTTSIITASQSGYKGNSPDRSIGVVPDFHHVPPTSARALESYMHLYIESSALAETTLKSSIERGAAR